MNRSRWERLHHIFDEARALPIDERSTFVARACAEDEWLRGEAQSLLEADAASPEFLTGPALQGLAQAMASDGWSLRSGEAIGPYKVLQFLGAGGAGEVWRARDDRLGRDVAIKVLLPHIATDPDRLRRFAEEARSAGALNHSNILTVYDVGNHHGTPYLVAEYLDGQSLRQRLGAQALSVADAVAIAVDIARGLAAAHAAAIVHRDLKPENTFLKSDGTVKILDFGLAKLQLSLKEPISTPHTITGVIVGTAGYMAPEQVNGEVVDGRADLFGLGVMLYEMLGRRHPFRQASTFDTLHAVVTSEPPDVSSLNADVPAPLSRIVTRLMAKAPGARFQSALDVIWSLEQLTLPSGGGPGTPRHPAAADRPRAPRFVSAGIAVIAAVALMAVWLVFARESAQQGSREPELTQFTWPLPDGVSLGSAPAVSPDSRHIAFVGRDAKASQLYMRDRRSTEATAIAGTEGATHPFWSPDGSSFGFFAGGRLMKMSWPGGAPVPLAEALFSFGATWSPSGTILFAPDVIMTGLSRVAAAGRDVGVASVLDMSLGDTSHAWPAFLPDGVHFLYFVRSARDDRRGVYVGSLDQTPVHARVPLLRSDSNVTYVPLPGTSEGELLSVVNGRIEARRFDAKTLTVTGDPRRVGSIGAADTTLSQSAMLSASPDVLVVATKTVPYGNRLEAVDRGGHQIQSWDVLESQNWPRLSPDGRYLARQRVDELRNTPDIWVDDLQRGTSIRVTTALEPDLRPAWSADGRYLAYVTGNNPGRPGHRIITIAAADGTGVVRTFPCPGGEYCEPTDWMSRGLLVNVIAGGHRAVWLVSMDRNTAAQPLLADTTDERDARLSPDGNWVAYVSAEGGRPEVLIRSIEGPARRIPVSRAGGDHPVWRRDGRELFYIDPAGQLRTVPVGWHSGAPALGLPSNVNVPPIGRGHWGTPYDVSADGSRVYLLRGSDDSGARDLHVIIGWRALLK